MQLICSSWALIDGEHFLKPGGLLCAFIRKASARSSSNISNSYTYAGRNFL